MLSLPGSGRFRRLGGIPGFKPASTLWRLERETRLRNQKLWKNKKIKSNYRQNQQRFQIYNKVSKTWASQIDESPILLPIQDIKNWRTFRTEKLQQHMAKTADISMLTLFLENNVSTTKFCAEFSATL